MEVQGWVVVGLAVVLFGYLIPYLARSRQQLADSRVDDRFSGALRVVATGATAKRPPAGEHHRQSPARPYLHDPRRRTEPPAVNRPTSHAERSAADARRLAALRAARAAEISRRQAAAHRRLVLTVVLLVVSVAGWVAFGATTLSMALAVVPTMLLGGVLVLGRRAAKEAARRNAADRGEMARLQLTPAARGENAARRAAGDGAARARTTRPAAVAERGDARPVAQGAAGTAGDDARRRVSVGAVATTGDDARRRVTEPDPEQAVTDGAQVGQPAAAAERADALTVAAGEHGVDGPADAAALDAPQGGDVPAERASAATDENPRSAPVWTPVSVPVPSYTLKPTAPRRDIAGYVTAEPAPEAASPTVSAEADTDPALVAIEASPYAPAPAVTRIADKPGPSADAESAPTGGLDLDSVLARRRAVGA